MVERQLPKLYVVGSIPIARSKVLIKDDSIREDAHEWAERAAQRLELVVPALCDPVRRVMWPPFYNRVEPSWIGIPFFYWYQLLWVIVGAMLTAIVYFATED